MPVNSTITRQYSDIDLSFKINPFTHDIAKKLNGNAVKQSIKNLILTRFKTRGFQPEFGSQIYDMLFEQFDAGTKINIEKLVQQAIENYEPRVTVNKVNVTNDTDNNAIIISINYTIVNSTESVTYTFSVYRSR